MPKNEGFRLDCPSRISLEAFFKDLQCLLHFIDLKYICDSGVILSLAWSLIE